MLHRTICFSALGYACAIGFLTQWPLAAQVIYSTPYTFTTLAGESARGIADGAGSDGRFWNPAGIVADTTENVYIADIFNGTIRKMTPAGEVMTFAGWAGNRGNTNGTGSAARFYIPAGICRDAAGNLYVAGYGFIRKITPDGVVGSMTSSGNVSSQGIAVDTATNLYVSSNNQIFKISPAGTLSSFAGSSGFSSAGTNDGTSGSARFNGPSGICIDKANNLYVADTGNHTIRKITPGQVVTTVAGLGGKQGASDGTGNSARFRFPMGVAVDEATNIFVADSCNHSIRKVTPAGTVTTLAGSARNWGWQDGTGTNAQFQLPFAVVVHGSNNLYVSDCNNSAIRNVSPDGVVTTIAGRASDYYSRDHAGLLSPFLSPVGIALDSAGNAFVADSLNHVILKVNAAGVASVLAGASGTNGTTDGTNNAARFDTPCGVAVDGSGVVYVADSRNHTIRRITPEGVVSTFAGVAGTNGSANGTNGGARFSSPAGVALDSATNLYVADEGNFVIRKITPEGAVSTFAGQAGVPGSVDGNGTNAAFQNPVSVAVDGTDNIFVADPVDHTVRKITPAGDVTTPAGLAGNSGQADGSGGDARFELPYGVTADAAGNVYIADFGACTIRLLTPAGTVTTLAGSTNGFADATGGEALFQNPSGLAVDGSGILYVADTGNGRLRKGFPPGVLPPTVLSRTRVEGPKFAFDVTGHPLEMVDILSSSNLVQWQPIGVYNLNAGSNHVVTPTMPQPGQYYRARSR